SGSSHNFSYVFSDASGFADITAAQIAINATLSPSHGCYFFVDLTNSSLRLANDAGTLGGPITLGSAGSVANSQCSVNAAGSSVSGSGTPRPPTAALSFPSAFAGAKTNFVVVADSAGQSPGWQAMGTWTVTNNAAPQTLSVNPASGSGSSHNFSYLFSD